MKRQGLAIFGIPLSNATLEETLQECIVLIDKNKKEKRSSHLFFVTNKQVTQIYGWRSSTILNSELRTIYFNAEISLTRSLLLRGFCKLLGSSLIPQPTIEQLLLGLCKLFSEHEKGIFFLGGIEKLTKNAAVALHEEAPGMRVVGIATPTIDIEGEDLVNAHEKDELLIEQINASNADLLVINLGSPKQEIWFNRIREKLKVPLAISVDNLLDKLGSQMILDKGALKKEKSSNILSMASNQIKLMTMMFPLLFYHNVSLFLARLFYAHKLQKQQIESRLFLSPHRTIAVIPLPFIIDASNTDLLIKSFEDAATHDVLVLDFRRVHHIQLEGFHLWIHVWRQRLKKYKEIYGFCPSRDIQCLMKLHRSWDFFKNNMCLSAEMLFDRVVQKDNASIFFDSISQRGSLVIIHLFGALSKAIDYQTYFQKLIPVIGQKNCAFDFSFCTFIDSTGFTFLLTMRKYLISQNMQLTLSSLSNNIHYQFRLAHIDSLFTIVKNTDDIPS